MHNPIIITQIVDKKVDLVWLYYTQPKHVVKWNQASSDWHTVSAKNDLKVGGRFNYRMEAKDGSFGFNFEGTYVDIVTYKAIHYILDDLRHVSITFEDINDQTKVQVKFEAQQENDRSLQESGWQAILNSFKNYAESL